MHAHLGEQRLIPTFSGSAAKTMFIFCGGVFRSGSTLQYQIVSQLVEDFDLGGRITWHSPDDFSEIRRSYGKQHRILVFKAHKLTSEMKEEVEANGAIIMTVHRDIRDVVVSAMKKNRWSFRKIWRNDRLRYWTKRFDEWAQQPQAHVFRYSDLITDLPQTVQAIANQLGLTISHSQASDLANQYSIENPKARAYEVAAKQQSGAISTKFDPHSLPHHNHIATGGIGEYKTFLKPHQISATEEQCSQWMSRWGYDKDEPKLTLAQHALRLTDRTKR
jgi:hypothetical protein